MTVTLDYGPHRTSEGYKFTTDDLDCLELVNLKLQVQKHNFERRRLSRKWGKVYGTLQRVSIMPRGSRVDHALADGFKYRHAYDSYLPQRHGEWFDIYVQDDNSNTNELKREIETGMKPGELKKMDKLERDIWKLKLKGMRRKRKDLQCYTHSNV